MLQIVYFSQTHQLLEELSLYKGERKIVTPSPAKADYVRTLFPDTKTDVLTIAKFTSELIEALWPAKEGRPNLKRKSEQLLLFGVLKSKYFSHLGYEQFIQSYNLFSDLRSFTLDLDAVSSILEQQPEDIRKAVELFWRLLDLMGICDEHGTYFKITETLRQGAEVDALKKTYIFWGFQHLNGQQVDLLKALAIRYDVIVPLPLELKDQFRGSDWPTWIKDSQTQVVLLPTQQGVRRGNWLIINSREIAGHLRKVLKPEDQIVLGVSKIKTSHLGLFPFGADVKISHQVINTEIKRVIDSLSGLSRDTTLTSLKEHINNQWTQLLSQQIALSELRYIKALQLLQEILHQIEEMTDEVVLIDTFFRKLLFEVLQLDQPRTALVTTSPLDSGYILRDMSSLETLKSPGRVIVCIDDRFEDILSLVQNYSEDVQRKLSALGPLKRGELDLLYRSWEFRNLFSEHQVLVLMSPSVLKHSLVWKRLFDGIELHPVEKTRAELHLPLPDGLSFSLDSKFSGSFSASKFQNYIDCPRKFYFNYVAKSFPQVQIEKDFDPMLSGVVIHKIIQTYIERKCSEDELAKLTSEIAHKYIALRALRPPPEVLAQRLLIFEHRASNGIKFLRDIEELVGAPFEWEIEKEFDFSEPYLFKGSIDCVGRVGSHLFLLDFKSTSYSASTNKEIENLESIQLWAYADAATRLIPGAKELNLVVGFVVLDDPEKSNLLMDDPELFEKLKINKSFRTKLEKKAMHEYLEAGQLRLKELVEEISSIQVFEAKPRRATICDYCELAQVCTKGVSFGA
jgi:hypothetical protein